MYKEFFLLNSLLFLYIFIPFFGDLSFCFLGMYVLLYIWLVDGLFCVFRQLSHFICLSISISRRRSLVNDSKNVDHKFNIGTL
jgi:hypothetical protein